MKQLAGILMTFYILVTALWLANSSYLFSLWGISIWLFSIGLGFVAFKQIKDSNVTKKLILYSSFLWFFWL